MTTFSIPRGLYNVLELFVVHNHLNLLNIDSAEFATATAANPLEYRWVKDGMEKMD